MNALTQNPLWFTTRACGTIALVLLTASVVVGIASAGRFAPRTLGRFEVAALHRNLSVLALAFLAMHILTALADSYVPLNWFSALIPFVSPYRTLWVGLGTVAFDVLLAVAITSAVRLRIGLRRWKAVHLSAYAAWPLAIFHGAGTGTDTKLGPQLLLYAGCVAAVMITCWWRLYGAGPGRVAARAWSAVAVGALPLVLFAFLSAGPLAPGWSHRAADITVTAPAIPPDGPVNSLSPERQ
ncbi:MAG TPA: ferric reductase-like transmembrane domain-containing protein [Actinocrinis sp.]|jgi:predicted ferric reductase